MMYLITSNESYRIVNGSITDIIELDKAERHLQNLVKIELLNLERKDLLSEGYKFWSTTFSRYLKRQVTFEVVSPWFNAVGEIAKVPEIWPEEVLLTG